MDYEKLGFLAISKGDYQEAINIFKKALENKKNANGFFGFGIAHYNLEDYQTARWAFYKALESEPQNNEIIRHISLVEGNIEKIKTQTQNSNSQRQALFRASKDYLEIFCNGNWSKFFIKGINLGLGLPGYFPGEYSIKKGTYRRWFEQIANLGINAIRTYTIHSPSFYEALYQFNKSGKDLYLFQGIWVELPEKNNFYDEYYLNYVKTNIKNAIHVIYGTANLPEKPGHAHGIYNYDVSRYTAAFIFGREWESYTVKQFNEQNGKKLKDYKGKFLSINDGTPFEVWVTEICDFLQDYEYEKYRNSLPLSVTNWPTLDPLSHPSESNKEAELLQFQGIKVDNIEGYLALQEDIESLDVSKIKTEKGGGFFATYHPYPYYPDFMNNDYLEEDNPYLTYLKDLKRHHGNQPVLVAEFGVPSSREVAHWHRDGWHHGGHSETRQGEINGLLMKAIYNSGMAGGILFSWFDEWFKRNWMFLPYYIPEERKPLWFNLQDPEENYGLLAAYPGYPKRKVYLTGQKGDWEDATTLYEKNHNSMVFRFKDSFDDARYLSKLLVQHDEGFLYILLETKGRIDFTQASYMIGLDTCYSQLGEFLLPFNTKVMSPIGLKFLIHLCGKEKSRILVCKFYDKYLNWKESEIKPDFSDQGAWVVMLNETNKRRLSKDGKRVFQSHVFSMSNLRFGTLDSRSAYYDSIADFFLIDNIIELRIPWGLINFTDPSSRMVLWKNKRGTTKKTAGIRIIAVSYKPEKSYLFAKSTGLKNNATDSLPENLISENINMYSWEDWNSPIYHTYLKESYHRYKEFLANIPEVI